MDDIVKHHQRAWYDHQIELLTLDREEMDALGYFEVVVEIDASIERLKKKRDEVPK